MTELGHFQCQCFVVCHSKRRRKPMRVFVDTDHESAFKRASAFLQAFNRHNASGRAILTRGEAELRWPVPEVVVS